MDFVLPKMRAVENNISFQNMTDAELDHVISQLKNGESNELD
jgi:hypothetical protein